MRSAFSLVELSIVLVILGLLVGGVLSGQSLIRASETRKLITLQNSYRTAILSFRDKYFGLPGDITNATQFWQRQWATSCVSNSGAPVVSATGTCDGDGDGFVYQTSGSDLEGDRVWEQLSRAGLIPGSYHYSAGGGLPSQLAIGVERPALNINNGAAIFNYVGVVNGVNMFPPNVHGNIGHFLQFAAPSPYGAAYNAGIQTPTEAYNIDTKLDDGRPGTGNVLEAYDPSDPNVGTIRCIDQFSSQTANFNLTFTAQSCRFFFRVL